ncbi:MAG TPA: FecR domain-containing protein [Pyrinomonadaceae bacterium]|nr:FecR domain-containing protein [Pyrinomonadaceae bacterium]
MREKTARFELEWLTVSKRMIYGLVVLGVLVVTAGAGFYLWKTGYFSRVGTDANVVAGARFDSYEGDVRVVRAETRETVQVRSDTRLMPGDIVQTQTDGRARITLVDGSTLLVNPNSVITIGDNTSAEDGRRTNVRVAVDRGLVKMRTEQQGEGTTNVVETPLSQNRLAGQTAASFNVREDKSEELRVGAGQVETNTRGGETTTVRGGEYVALNQSGHIKNRERLLEVPTPLTPQNMEKVQAKAGGAAGVQLRWQRPAVGAPAYYRVELATSPFFVAAGKVIERDQLNATEFAVGDLRAGNYFWRVRAVAASNQASEWSEAQKFMVVAGGGGDGGSVGLADVKTEYLAGQIYLVSGRTQPGNQVRAAGRSATASADGTFQLQVSAPKGTREISLDVEDLQGNKRSHRVAFGP